MTRAMVLLTAARGESARHDENWTLHGLVESCSRTAWPERAIARCVLANVIFVSGLTQSGVKGRRIERGFHVDRTMSLMACCPQAMWEASHARPNQARLGTAINDETILANEFRGDSPKHRRSQRIRVYRDGAHPCFNATEDRHVSLSQEQRRWRCAWGNSTFRKHRVHR